MLRAVSGLLLIASLSAAGRDRVVLDTDSGFFGDDGAALVMLLRSPGAVSLSGITLVPGNVWPAQGAAYTFHILEILKQTSVPLYTAGEAPLVHTAAMVQEAARRWEKPEFLGAFAEPPVNDALASATVPSRDRKEAVLRAPVGKARPGGVEFLISEIERYPGEVTILAIGPMTNIAMALRLKPEIESRIRRIVFLGGNVRVRGNVTAAAEFNFWFDPEAAAIVLRSRIQQKVMFPLDICNLAPVRRPEFDELVAVRTPLTDLIREDLGNRYPGFLRDARAKSYMWDTLAAAYLIDPGFVTRTESQYLDVDTTWGRSYGATIPLDRRIAPGATPVTVGLALDLSRVWTLCKNLLKRKE